MTAFLQATRSTGLSASRPTRRRWWWRAVGGLLLYAVLEIVFTVVDFAPDALRLALLVGVCVAAVGLVHDSMADSGPTWTAQPVQSLVPPGADPRLAAYVRLIEDHLTSRDPDSGLRDRLVALSDGRLTDDLAGPPRRLTTAQIDDYLRRIEER